MPRPALRVRFLSGPRRGQETAFRHSPVRAGRSRDSDLRLPDTGEPTSSAHHAAFVFEHGQWWVVDLGSTNGTRLNGSPVVRARLRDRDRLGCGDQELEVRVRTLGGWRLAATAVVVLGVVVAGWYAWRGTHGALDRIAAAGRQSVYLLIIQDGDRRTPVGTAFAVDRHGRLATNAHVAAPLEALIDGSGPGVPYAVGPEEPPRRITGVRLHPAWRQGSMSNDAAIVTVAGPATMPLRLSRASPRAGSTIAVFGFPAAVTESEAPRGSLTVTVVREVRGADYFVLAALVAPGSSGSPVFGEDGSVIGMVTGSGLETGGPAWPGSSPGVAVGLAPVRDVMR